MRKSDWTGGERIEFANTPRGVAAVSVVVAHYANFWTARPLIAGLIFAEPIPETVQSAPHY